MSDAHRIAAKPALSTTPEAELNALATVYRRAVERYEEAHEMKKGGPATAPDDAMKGSKNDRAASSQYT